MKEVYPGIFRITESGVLGIFKPPVNIYVIAGNNGLIYDAGYGDRFSVNSFVRQFNEIKNICHQRGEEFRVDRILLSHAHPDHFAGLKRLRGRLGLRVLISADMRSIIKSSAAYRGSYERYINDVSTPAKRIRSMLIFLLNSFQHWIYSMYWGIYYIDDPDLIIESESAIEINNSRWEIFLSPGHSSEHITLYQRKSGILFSGDNILDGINVWLGPPKSDLDQYEKTLKRIMKLKNLKIIFPAHGEPLLNPYKRITEILHWRKKRTEDVIMILKSAEHAVSVNEVACYLYPSDSRIKKSFALGWIELTLEKLVNTGRAVRTDDRYIFKR